jgi:hypothetical protein
MDLDLYLTMASLAISVAVGSAIAYRIDKRRAAEARWQNLIELVRSGGLVSALLQLKVSYERLFTQADVDQRNALQVVARSRQWLSIVAEQLRASRLWSLQAGAMVAATTLAWGFLFPMQRNTDIAILEALNHTQPALYGTIIAVVFSVIGIVITGILGLHGAFFGLRPASMTGRAFTALMLSALSIGAAVFLGQLSTYRSEHAYGAQVLRDQTTKTQLQAEQTRAANAARQLEIDVLTANLRAEEEQLQRSKQLDSSLTILTLIVEMATSASPLLASKFAVAGCFALTSVRNGRKAEQAENRKVVIAQQFRAEGDALLGAAGVANQDAEDAVRSTMGRLADWDIALALAPPDRLRTDQWVELPAGYHWKTHGENGATSAPQPAPVATWDEI